MSSPSSKILLVSVPVAIAAGAAILLWHKNRSKALRAAGHVSGLYIYPIKACKGIPLVSARCLQEGLEYDRRWVIVDGKGNTVNLSRVPRAVLISPHFDEDMTHLCLAAPGMETLKVPRSRKTDQHKDIQVLRTMGEGVSVGDEAEQWLSKFLGMPGCQLYHVTKPRFIADDSKWGSRAKPNDRMAFANNTALMVCSQASLKELNNSYESPVNMDRFRANVIIDGGKPYEEDLWRRLRIGDEVELRWIKECSRCPVINVDPLNGERTVEPLRTLNRVRKIQGADPKHEGRPWFGWNCAPDVEGLIKVGDPVFASC